MKKRRNESVTPYIPYGPATGVPTLEPKNEVLGSDRYDGDSTPGTADHAKPGHVPGGPGHGSCSHG